MMQAADTGQGDNFTVLWPMLDGARDGCVLAEGVATSIVVVVSDILGREPVEVPRFEHDEVVEQLPPK